MFDAPQKDIPEPGPYDPPVAGLLTLDFDLDHPTAPDYRSLGLGPKHIPDLVRMATDMGLNLCDSDGPEMWAPFHAARALGQLQAVEAVTPLLEVAERLPGDDYLSEALAEIFGQIGPDSIPALDQYLAATTHNLFARARASSGLATLGNLYPEHRAECLALLSNQIEHGAQNDPTLNGFIIGDLTNMRAVESAPLIEQAFAQGLIDESIMGDWEDVQVMLGLLSARRTPREPGRRSRLLPTGSDPVWPPAPPSDAEEKVARQRFAKQKKSDKAKRKQAEKARKRNHK